MDIESILDGIHYDKHTIRYTMELEANAIPLITVYFTLHSVEAKELLLLKNNEEVCLQYLQSHGKTSTMTSSTKRRRIQYSADSNKTTMTVLQLAAVSSEEYMYIQRFSFDYIYYERSRLREPYYGNMDVYSVEWNTQLLHVYNSITPPIYKYTSVEEYVHYYHPMNMYRKYNKYKVLFIPSECIVEDIALNSQTNLWDHLNPSIATVLEELVYMISHLREYLALYTL